MSDIKVNEHGVNTAIKATVLPDKEMREIGFTDYREGYWYFGKYFGFGKRKYDISFGVSINKDNPEDLRIDVLDEDFCQPYDYQHMLEKQSTFSPALKVQEFVEEWMEYLQNKGVLSGHVRGEYI